MVYEWTDLTYQQILAGNGGGLRLPLVVLLVFLVLAAQYESWSLPLAIILIVPMTLFSALLGVNLMDGDGELLNFHGEQHLPQIGFIVLVGLVL